MPIPLILRAQKGAALTFDEVDGNFVAIAEVADTAKDAASAIQDGKGQPNGYAELDASGGLAQRSKVPANTDPLAVRDAGGDGAGKSAVMVASRTGAIAGSIVIKTGIWQQNADGECHVRADLNTNITPGNRILDIQLQFRNNTNNTRNLTYVNTGGINCTVSGAQHPDGYYVWILTPIPPMTWIGVSFVEILSTQVRGANVTDGSAKSWSILFPTAAELATYTNVVPVTEESWSLTPNDIDIAGGVMGLNTAQRGNKPLEITNTALAGSNVGRTFVHAAGAHSNVSSITGAWVIKLANVTSMHSVNARAYNYGTGVTRGLVAFETMLYHTNGQAGGTWSAQYVSHRGTLVLPIKHAIEAATGRRCVIVGDVGQIWSYPALNVLDSVTHRSTITNNGVTETVDVEFVTNLDAYHSVVEVPDTGPYASANAINLIGRTMSGVGQSVPNAPYALPVMNTDTALATSFPGVVVGGNGANATVHAAAASFTSPLLGARFLGTRNSGNGGTFGALGANQVASQFYGAAGDGTSAHVLLGGIDIGSVGNTSTTNAQGFMDFRLSPQGSVIPAKVMRLQAGTTAANGSLSITGSLATTGQISGVNLYSIESDNNRTSMFPGQLAIKHSGHGGIVDFGTSGSVNFDWRMINSSSGTTLGSLSFAARSGTTIQMTSDGNMILPRLGAMLPAIGSYVADAIVSLNTALTAVRARTDGGNGLVHTLTANTIDQYWNGSGVVVRIDGNGATDRRFWDTVSLPSPASTATTNDLYSLVGQRVKSDQLNYAGFFGNDKLRAYFQHNDGTYVELPTASGVRRIAHGGSYVEILASDGVARGVSYNVSDRNKKKNIKPSTASALGLIDLFRFFSFFYRADSGMDPTLEYSIGAMAQDMEAIDSTFVETLSDGTKMPVTMPLLMLALKANQELNEKLRLLTQRVEELERRNG